MGGVGSARASEVGVNCVGHSGRRRVVDSPQGGDHMAVSEELSSGGHMKGLVEQAGVARGGVTCGEEGEIGVLHAQGGEVGNSQRSVLQGERAQ